MDVIARAAGSISRGLGRPELLAVVSAGARQEHRESIGITAILASCLRPGDTYVDVGTNRGQILRDAVRVAPSGHHWAFEPIPSLATYLAAEFAQVECRCMAIGASAETAEFCHFTRVDGWSGLRKSPEIGDEQGAPVFIQVPVSTLDAELAGTTPRVVKIDVEGAELAVLQGASSVLADARPVLIFEHQRHAGALYGASSEDIWELLDESGYTIFSVTGDGPYSRTAFSQPSSVVNWLARPRS